MGRSLPFIPLMHTASGHLTGPRDHHHHTVACPHGGMLHPCSVRCVPEILGSGISDMPYVPVFLNDFGKFTEVLLYFLGIGYFSACASQVVPMHMVQHRVVLHPHYHSTWSQAPWHNGVTQSKLNMKATVTCNMQTLCVGCNPVFL